METIDGEEMMRKHRTCLGVVGAPSKARSGRRIAAGRPLPPIGVSLLIALACFGCATARYSNAEVKTEVKIDPSASGWQVRPGPSDSGSDQPTTVLVSPTGRQFNMGETIYPDPMCRSQLYLVTNRSLQSRFLVLLTPPAASAATPLTLYYLRADGRPFWAATVVSHLESLHTDARTPNQWLFKDVDGDGVDELIENDVWKDGGRVTYHRFGGERFFSDRIEVWQGDHAEECGVSMKSSYPIANFTHR